MKQDLNNIDDDVYVPLSRQENVFIFSLMFACSLVWLVLFFTLPKPIVIGYLVIMGLGMTALWFRPFKKKIPPQ